MKRLLKFLHLFGAIAFGGALCAGLGLLVVGARGGPERWPLLGHAALAGASWLLLPALLVTVVSGLLSIAAHRPFMEQAWVWEKAMLGMVIASVTLFGLEPALDEAQGAALRAVAGMAEDAHWSGALRTLIWGGCGALVLSVAAVALGVWRPRRLIPRRRR